MSNNLLHLHAAEIESHRHSLTLIVGCIPHHTMPPGCHLFVDELFDLMAQYILARQAAIQMKEEFKNKNTNYSN